MYANLVFTNHQSTVGEGRFIFNVTVSNDHETVAGVFIVDKLTQSFQSVTSSVVSFSVDL